MVMGASSEIPIISQNIEKTGIDPGMVLGVIWLVGLCLLLAYSFYSLWRLHRMVQFAVKCEEGIYESDRLETAFVLGFFRPRIYLPAGLSERERQFITEHERIHIRRHDHQWKLAAWLITLIHWFNPVLWASFWLMGRDMELSCDERVLKNLGLHIRADYGDSLLALAAPEHFPGGATPAFGEGNIRLRVKNVLAYRPVKLGVTCGALLLVAATLLGCMGNPEKEAHVGMVDGAVFPKREAAGTLETGGKTGSPKETETGVETEPIAEVKVADPETHLELVKFVDNAPYYDLSFQKIEGRTGKRLLFPTKADPEIITPDSVVDIVDSHSLVGGYSYGLIGEENVADTIGIRFCNWNKLESILVKIDGLEYEVGFPMIELVEKNVNREFEAEGAQFVVEKAIFYPKSIALEISGDGEGLIGDNYMLIGLLDKEGNPAMTGGFEDDETGKFYLLHTFEDGVPQGNMTFRVKIIPPGQPKANKMYQDFRLKL